MLVPLGNRLLSFLSVYYLAPPGLLVFISCFALLLSAHSSLIILASVCLVLLSSSFLFCLCVQFLAPVSLLCSFFFPLICWLASFPSFSSPPGCFFGPPFLLLWDFIFLLVDGGWYCKHHKNNCIEKRWFLWCSRRQRFWIIPECSGSIWHERQEWHWKGSRPQS